MTHVQVDPAFSALEARVRVLDRERDHLRAQMADAALKADIGHVDREFWHTPEQRAAKRAALEERFAKRMVRRAAEMANFGSYTRPGSWDYDLDNFQEDIYTEKVGDFTIQLKRARDLTYTAYVILPEGHGAIGKSYNEVNEARPPVYLSHSVGNTFGFYFERTVKPRDYGCYDEHNFYSAEQTGYVPGHGSNYYDYAKMRECCIKLIDFFAGWHVPKVERWNCPNCGVEGPPEKKIRGIWLPVCHFCDEPHGYLARPESSVGSDEPHDGTRETDWRCLSCNWPNPESTDACCNCYLDKSEAPAGLHAGGAGEPPTRRRTQSCADMGLCVCGGCFAPALPEPPKPTPVAAGPPRSWAQIVRGK